MARRSKRSYRLAALKGWSTRRTNAKISKSSKKSGYKPGRYKKKTPKNVPRKMWRVTVGAPYEIRQHGKKKNRASGKKGSPDKASYMVRGWYSSYEDAIQAQEELEELALAGRDSYEDETPRAFHRDEQEEVNIEITTVDYNPVFLDIVTETNEK